VNNELENRRGRKLYANDVIEIPGSGTFQVQA
ncbi:RNA-binding S4 domain-containing protein, partial [Bacillus cereus]